MQEETAPTPPAEEPQPPPGRIHQWAEQAERQIAIFGEWMNYPEDMEGVWTRIATMALIFFGMVTFTLSMCLIIYGATWGLNALFS